MFWAAKRRSVRIALSIDFGTIATPPRVAHRDATRSFLPTGTRASTAASASIRSRWSLAVLALFALPVLVGLGLRWSAHAEIAQLQTDARKCSRSRTAATARRPASSPRSCSPCRRPSRSSARAPRSTRTSSAPSSGCPPRQIARGGRSAAVAPAKSARPVFVPGFNVPEDTFGVLRDLLYSLEGRLRTVQVGVERRQALAAATPTIWPAQGWLTDAFGKRSDPFTGEEAVPQRPRHLGRPRTAGLCHRRRHRAVGRPRGRLRQHGHDRPRLRPGDPLRAPAGVQGGARRRRSAAAT